MIFYGGISLAVVVATFWETVVVMLYDQRNSEGKLLFIVVTYSLAILLSIAVNGFLIFHTWLISNNTTTIEYCEKRRDSIFFSKYPYKKTCFDNLKDFLGNNLWIWMLPIGYEKTEASGLHFNANQIN